MTLTPEEIVQIARPYSVSKLYKYRSSTDRGLMRIFTHQEIFMANPTQFNDPFDCRPILKASDDPKDRRKFLSLVIRHEFPQASQQEQDVLIKKGLKRPYIFDRKHLDLAYLNSITPYGVYCLSENNNNILMWSHYAKDHTGLCLEFDSSTEETFFWESLKVHYQDNIPLIDPMLFDEDDNFLKALAVKSCHWKHEEERRIIKTIDEGGSGLHRFEPATLTGVTIGANMSEEDEEMIEYLANHYPTPIRISYAITNKDEYALDIVSNKLGQT